MEVQQPRILIIEDDRDFRDVLAFNLERAGYDTLLAAQGTVGLRMADAYRPDVILCDVKMPVLDGHAVLEALRGNPATAAIPCILMTVAGSPRGRRAGMSMGADDYLAKPFEMADLLASIQAQLRKRQAMRQQAEARLHRLRASISTALPHELRTPLTGILSAADLLLHNGTSLPADELHEIISVVHEAGTRLQRLVENFLVYAQVEILALDTQETTALRESCTADPGAMFEQAACAQARRYGRAADLQADGTPHPVVMSPAYLRKIAEELLDNAFKFSEPGTPVRVEMHVFGADLLVRVIDHGRGMKPQAVEQIGAYVQFERTLHEQQGAGLGLQIVKRLMHLHGGQFCITSGAGRGTTVELLFPGSDRPAAAPDAALQQTMMG